MWWVVVFRLCGAITHGRWVGDVEERLAEQLLHLQLNLQAAPNVTRASSSSSSSVGLRQISSCGLFLFLEFAANPRHTSCRHSNPIQVFCGFFHLVRENYLSVVLQCPIEPKSQATWSQQPLMSRRRFFFVLL